MFFVLHGSGKRYDLIVCPTVEDVVMLLSLLEDEDYGDDDDGDGGIPIDNSKPVSPPDLLDIPSGGRN